MVDREKITIQYKTFLGQPTTLTSEEEAPEIPPGASIEFLFGLTVHPDSHTLSVYETKSIDNISVTGLPIIRKYMDLIADSVRMLEKLT